MFCTAAPHNAFSRQRYVLPVILAVVSVFAAAESIESPCSIKQPPLLQRELFSEFSDGRLQMGEQFFKNVNDLDFIFRPIAGDWIQSGERSENGRTELDRRSTKGVSSLSRNSESVGNQPRKASASGGEKPQIGRAKIKSEEVHPSIWVFIAIILVSFFQSGSSIRVKPNVRAKGPAAAGRLGPD